MCSQPFMNLLSYLLDVGHVISVHVFGVICIHIVWHFVFMEVFAARATFSALSWAFCVKHGNV